MNARHLFLKFFSILSVFFFLSCASGKKEYTIGMQLNSAGKHREAISYLKRAMEIEPNNKEYRQSLAEIQEALVRKYIAEGRAEFSGGLITINSINNARAKLSDAKEIDPTHMEVISLTEEIQRKNEELLSEVKDLYDKTREMMNAREYVKAAFNLQQIQGRFPNYEDTFQLNATIIQDGTRYYFDQAKSMYDAEDFKGAIETIRNALILSPDHEPSHKLMAMSRKNDNKDYFINGAKEAVAEKDFDRAVRYYEQALLYEPGNNDLKSAIALARDYSGKMYIRKARERMQDGWLFRACNDLVLAKKYTPEDNQSQVVSLTKDMARKIQVAAEDFKAQEKYGAAWFWYKQLKDISPDFPEIFELTLAMEDKISRRVRKSIAVFDFASPSGKPDAGALFANNLINYLFNNASGDIKIIERERLKSIVEEMKLGQTGMTNEESTKQMGDLYGIDVAIMGEVLKYHVEKSVAQSTKSVRYQTGTKIEDNIEYLNWRARNPKPSEKELAKAPPAKVSLPEFTSKDYNVSQHKKVGFVQMSFRIVDIGTGENIQFKTIERKMVAEDETSAGLEEAEIAFDPLEIISDTELLNKMTDEVVAELGREVLRPLQNLEQQYFQTGETMLRRRNNLTAVESFVDAILDEKLKMIQDSPLARKAMQNIKDIFSQHNHDI